MMKSDHGSRCYFSLFGVLMPKGERLLSGDLHYICVFIAGMSPFSFACFLSELYL